MRAPPPRLPRRQATERLLKVFHFRGVRDFQATREVVAVASGLAAMRAFGCSRREFHNFGGMGVTKEETALALASPGAVFWRPLDSRDPAAWQRADPPVVPIPQSLEVR